MPLIKILIVEDEADILDVLDYGLSREGYKVLSTRDGDEGIRLAREQAPHLILLDVMLPGRDGVEVCRVLKSDPVTRDIPIIMVTAKGEESDVVLGLGVGADDYVTKPFGQKELVARVRTVLRRARRRVDGGDERVVFEHVVIDAVRHEVLLDGTRIEFTPTELRLLHLLASQPGRAFTRGQLLTRVIGDAAYVIDRNIDVHVRSVRKKLAKYRDAIETVRGVGYRFNAEGL
ncbi:MAG TPA: response regulator [Gemmatimonadales bacterium]|jgi:DNA-binding response OmpR family regulator